MATILGSFTDLLSSSATREIGQAVGLQPDLVSKGMALAGPLITTALAKQASTSTGMADLMQLVPKDGLGSILGNLGNLVRGRPGAGAVTSIFGSGSTAIAETLDRALGFKASSLLGIAAPLVLGLVGEAAAENKLGANGIASMLAGEAAQFQKAGGEGARLVQDALDAGRQATELKAKYSPVQWDSVRLAPVAAAHVIMMADKSGPVGAVKELNAAAGVIDDAKKGAAPTSLVRLAFERDFSADELSKFARGRTPADALATVREAIDVVERHNPSDAPQFRRLVADVATRVANASKEGGILGIGGTRVSTAEQAALDAVRTVTGQT